MKDVTVKYAGMIERFESDFTLAEDPENDLVLYDLQCKIEDGDQQILADIRLLQELDWELRNGRVRIMENAEAGGESHA